MILQIRVIKSLPKFRIHYIEYLVRQVRLNHLEPLPVFNIDDLETCILRAGKKLPANWYGRDPADYRKDLTEVIKTR